MTLLLGLEVFADSDIVMCVCVLKAGIKRTRIGRIAAVKNQVMVIRNGKGVR